MDMDAHPLEGGTTLLSLFVQQIRFEAVGINSYEFVDPEGRNLPPVEPGSHVDVHLPGGIVRQYSLCNAPSECHRYVIAVLRDELGRGGSRALHDRLHVQDRVWIGLPRNNFPLAGAARRHLLVGGGIGITPLKAMVHELAAIGADYELHYCAKSTAHAAFAGELAALCSSGRLICHYDGGNPAEGLDIAKLLSAPAEGTHLYYCGPPGFMAACAAASAHWPSGSAHCEHFKAPVASSVSPAEGSSCCVEIASSGQRLEVPCGRRLVDVLNEAGFAVPTSCVSGLCGSCKLRYLAGEVEHQDFILSEEDRSAYLTTCVSRPKNGVLVLDL
jgi:vanillate O-demethylase ferredoxin subunit